VGITAVTPGTSSDLDGLYRELQPELVRYAEGMLGNRADAEEAVQDAFLAATRVSATGAPGFAEARPWLYRVTRNASIDRIRRRKLSVAIEDVAETAPSEDLAPQHAAELSVDLEVLRIGLERLNEQQRSALVLRELSGLSYGDIAEVLGVSESNVKVLIFRARKSLQALADAVDLDCDDAQLALSARHDGECGRGEGARARLHAATCRSCRRFERAISTQTTGLAALFPLAAVGLKTGGTLGGLFGAKAAAVAAATVALVGGGSAAVYEAVHAHHGAPPHRPAPQHSGPAAPSIAPISRPEHADDHPGRAGDDHGGNSGPGGGGESESRGRQAEGEGPRGQDSAHDLAESGSGKSTSGSGSGTSGGSGSSGSSGGSGSSKHGGGSDDG
jgi:RNA polymerase sigma factor (sigma-70 family)